VGALELGAEYQFTGKRYNDTNNTQQLGGYALANVTASYPLSRHASVQLRWNNIFNKDYVTTMGYQTPGSNVFINLSLQM
jgi:vitamin B12 transporter